MNFDFVIYYIGGIVTYILVVACATSLFLQDCRRKKNFVLRFIISLVVVMLIGCLFSLQQYYVDIQLADIIIANIVNFVIYFVLFILWIIALALCYEEPLIRLVVAAALGGICQNIAYSLYSIINLSIDLDVFLYMNFQKTGYVIGQTLQIILAIAVLTASYFLFAKKIVKMSFTGKDDVGMYITLALSKLILPILNAIGNIYTSSNQGQQLFVRCTLMICKICILILYIKMIQVRSIMKELEIVEKLNRSEHEHFLRLKREMELVNIKSHDIKHFLAKAGVREGIDLLEISNAITIYDTTVKTGNEILDTFIAERSLDFSIYGIKLRVMARAENLDFLSVTDTCALFGNILENAIEAVKNVEEGERFINMRIQPTAGWIFINVENTFAGRIEMKDGIPQTTKIREEGYHGYGIKSMKMIAEKYGGIFSCKAEDGIFRLHILFPEGGNTKIKNE